MSSVKLEDNKLYITSEAYSSFKGRHMNTEVLLVENIECIKAKVGPQGGMHTWSIRGYYPEYSDASYNKGKERDQEIYSGDRKNSELIDKILEVLPKIKYHEKKEKGGAPW